MTRTQICIYFANLVATLDTTPDTLQGGISVIRNPALFNDETLKYWYTYCTRLKF